MSHLSVSTAFQVARAYSFVWRFRTLRIADRLKTREQGIILHRPFFGYDLHLDVSRANTHRLLYLEGERFVGEAKLIASLLRPGDSVVDVGANIGYYTLMLERTLGSNGKIICFEPEPDNIVELRRNIELNGLQNVEVVWAAVGQTNGAVNLVPGLNGIVSKVGSVTVPEVTLDSALRQAVDLIKIDVEGYEANVLLGATQIIEQYHPALFVELHPCLLVPGLSIADIVEFVRTYYPSVKFYEPVRTKLRSRYLGQNVVQLSDSILDECRAGKREPFWMICRSDHSRGFIESGY